MAKAVKVVAPKGKVGHNLKGRQKGVKNKTTIFKEFIRGGFENSMKNDFKKVYEAVLKEALDGNMTAAKLLFDRALPSAKMIDLDELEAAKGVTISINIESLTSPEQLKVINPED